MTRIEIIFFIGATLIMAFLTWFISLRGRRNHGFFRFFSFECIILLILLVYKDWFDNPFSWHQILSWIFLIASLLVALFSFIRFYKTGKPRDGMEDATQLIDQGMFAYIRHPLYFSLILGGLGIMWKHPGEMELLISGINIIALYLTARVEEKEMMASFGNEYAEYMKKTRMFIPYIF